jgi:competence protein ComGC
MRKYNLRTRRFDLKSVIIALMGVVIIVLLLLMVLPKMTASLRAEGFEEGVTMCQTQVMTKIVDDLNTQQFTAIQIGDQTVRLGILDVKEIQPGGNQ